MAEWNIWAAGFFDGEGCVRITKATKQNLGALSVEISNTERAALEEFEARYGGRLREATGMRPRQRQAWVWVAAAGQALAFLTDIEPHVQIDRNRERIALAREFQGGARRGRHGSGQDYRNWRFGCYLRMRALNRRGVPA